MCLGLMIPGPQQFYLRGLSLQQVMELPQTVVLMMLFCQKPQQVLLVYWGQTSGMR